MIRYLRFRSCFLLLAQLVFACGIPALLLLRLQAQVTSPAPTPGGPPTLVTLEAGRSQERELNGAAKHLYGIALTEGQFADVIVEQRGVDVVVTVMDPAGKKLAEYDFESRLLGQERVGLSAASTGIYQFEVKAKYSKNASGRYEIRVAEVRVAGEKDRNAFESHKLATQGMALLAQAKYDDSIKTIQSAIALNERGDASQAFLGYLTVYLADAQQRKGDYANAETTAQRAIDINEKALGEQHPQTALAIDTLGLVYRSEDDYLKAEQYFQRALKIDEKVLGPEHRMVAQCLMQVSLARQKRGDFETAAPLLQRALAVAEKALEQDDFQIIAIVHNLGNLYLEQGDVEHAETWTERSLSMIEKKYGPDDWRDILALRNLGSIARMKKQYDKALALFGRAETLQEKIYGDHHPETAALLINVGNVYKEEGNYAKALELFLRALDILKTAVGPYHTYVLNALANITNTYSALGDEAHAIQYEQKVYALADKQIELTLATGSERQKLAFADVMAQRTDRLISLHVREMPNDAAAGELAALAVLRRKGRVLDAMARSVATLREHMRPEDEKLIEELSTTTAQLAKFSLDGPGKMSDAEYEQQLHALQEKREGLEASISQSSAGYYDGTGPVSLNSVRAAIPDQTALIEFAVYSPFDPKASDENGPEFKARRYVAYVISNKGDIGWKDLGKAKDIDQSVRALREALRDPARNDVRQLARALDQQVLQPLRPLAGNATRLLISPDGELSLVPFEALIDEQGRFGVENYAITYLTSGRDLVRLQVARTSKSAPVIVANPDFGQPAFMVAKASEPKANAMLATRSITTAQDLSTVYFAPLPGTAQEANLIHSLFPESHVLTGTAATESALKKIDAPRILHIATHGFFLQDPGPEGLSENGGKQEGQEMRGLNATVRIENPLLRSGLALAGANLSKSGSETGILTALEAANLNLWGTELVTLSACDTGVGKVTTGEGIYGLRRSLFLAGAKTLVMSLWPVSDHVTREMMTAYYAGLKKGRGRGEALRQAELAMLKRKGREHPFYWASFIQSGEWANLEGQR